MNDKEVQASDMLFSAKNYCRAAWRELDPAATDPVSVAILKALDAIDEARKELKRRPSV